MWGMSSIFLSLDSHNGGRGKAHSAKRIAQKPEIRSRKSEVRGQKTEIRGQMSEIGGQMSEVRGQRAESREPFDELRTSIGQHLGLRIME